MPKPKKPVNYFRPDPHATLVHRRQKVDFSMTGLVYAALIGFMGLAAMNSQANLLFAVFGLMIGIFAVSFVVSSWVLRRLSLHRVLPEAPSVGVPAVISYELRNNKRYWPTFSVTVSELDGTEAFTKQSQSYVLHAAPRMTAIVPAQLVPKRRGLHRLDRYQLSTSFPFGFIKRATNPEASRHEETLLVYPALAQVDPKLLQLMRSAESTGTTMRPRRGGNDEFYGLKEFRSGENPRYIYWRRSARTGTLVAKEMTRASPPRIIVLVDTYLRDPNDRTKQANVERSIAMAASLASHALEDGLSVGLVCWTEDGWTRIPTARGKRHRRDLLTILARLPNNLEHDATELISSASELQESAVTMVLFGGADNGANGGGRSLTSAGRGDGAMVIPPDSPQSQRWFRFNPSIDFSHCMPADQEPTRSEPTRKSQIGNRQ